MAFLAAEGGEEGHKVARIGAASLSEFPMPPRSLSKKWGAHGCLRSQIYGRIEDE
jgi:hypothetical protein